MIKREFKLNFKSFLIYLLVLIGMFLLVYLIYPYIITDANIEAMNELMKAFPPEVLKTFNMDMSSIETAYGWFKTEGFTFILLITGIYSSILGGNILLREESEKTIEYLDTLPVKRSKIVTSKVVTGITYIFLMIFIFFVFNLVGITLSCEFNTKEFILLSISPLLVCLPLFSINLFISTLLKSNKSVIGFSLGEVFIFYVLSILSELSTKVEFLKYITIYTLSNTREILTNLSIKPIYIIISLATSIVFILLSYGSYQRKELV